MICSVCEPTADKKTCLECYSKMLFNCDVIECVRLHLLCPWCRTPLSHRELKGSVLYGSNAYNRAAVKLQTAHLCDFVFDRQDTTGMLNASLQALMMVNQAQQPARMNRLRRARQGHMAVDSFLQAFEEYSSFREMHPTVTQRRELYEADARRTGLPREEETIDNT